MNQSNALKRTSISFGLAVIIALLALSIQDYNHHDQNNFKVEAKVYPDRTEMLQR